MTDTVTTSDAPSEATVPVSENPTPKPSPRKRKPATRRATQRKATEAPVAVSAADAQAIIDAAVQAQVKAALQQLGVLPPDDPEPTEEPEDPTFRKTLWLAGNAAVTRQPTIYLPGSRVPIKFRDGFCTFIGEEGRQAYEYVKATYSPDEVFEETWDPNGDDPRPTCAQCGWSVPSFRAFNKHQTLHQVPNVQAS